jgi:SynChlorMet cassette radical SAM/SPASM protein ScmE
VERDLPGEEWCEFFEELNRCAVMRVILGGGEPFCRKDIRELVQGIVRNRMRFQVLSNATLITDDMAAFLHSTGRCSGVQISIDGSNAAIHDSCRGTGTFAKAMEGVHILRKHDVPVDIRVTIHKHNVHDLEAVSRLLLEETGLPGFSTNSASYLGLCRQDADDLRLNIDEQILAMETLLKLNKKYNGRIHATSGPLANAKTWLEMERCRREGKERNIKCGYLTACGCIMSEMAVRADGVMVPCNLLSHIELGRINRDNVENIWQNHPGFKRLRDRRQVPLDRFEFCSGCVYIDYCTGNCPAAAHSILGDDNHPSPDSCLKRFFAAGGRLPVGNNGDNHE